MASNSSLWVSLGISIIIFTLLTSTATSLIDTFPHTFEKEDFKKMIQDSIDEFSTYLSFEDVFMKYEQIGEKRVARKIAIQIKPFFSKKIELSDITLELCNEYHMIIQYFNGQVGNFSPYPLFEHPLWNNLNDACYTIVVVLDKDNSLQRSHLFNDNTDRAYILINLPDIIALEKGDSLMITVTPSDGIAETVTITAPFSISPIVKIL